MSAKGPKLSGYLERTVSLHLNKGRKVQGTLRGYDQFMNVVLDDAADMSEANAEGGGAQNIGTVSVRGNSIVQFELIAR